MRIGGLLKWSLIDYPGKVAAVVFTQGCPFRCPYCHNPELVIPAAYEAPLDAAEVMRFLDRRRGRLEGVVVTGGEPTVQPGLAAFLERIRALGYPVKLDTNGCRPEVLRALIARRLVQFIAMDVKAPWDIYPRLSGVPTDTSALRESVGIIAASGLPHQFRTTVVKAFLTPDDVAAVRRSLPEGSPYILQAFSAEGPLIDPSLRGTATYTSEEFEDLRARWERR